MFFALWIIYSNIISPLLESSDSTYDEQPIDVPGIEPAGIEINSSDQQAASSQLMSGFNKVETGKLFWNEKLQRDPFSVHILNRQENNSVNRLAQNSSARKVRRTRLNLTAVIKGTDSKFAVINGKVVKLGEVISGYRLEQINTYSVVLAHVKGAESIKVKLSNGQNSSRKDHAS